MAIERTVSNDFFLSKFVDSIKVFDCRLSCVSIQARLVKEAAAADSFFEINKHCDD